MNMPGSRVGILLIAGSMLACTVAPEQRTYVGKVAGSDTFVAFVTDGVSAAGYSCGGDSTRDTQTAWFTGEVYMDTHSLFIDCGSLGFFADFDDDTATGSFIDSKGAYRHFSARTTRPGSLEGLYRAKDPTCSTGAIVIEGAAGTEPDVRGAWCNGGGVFAQVTPMFTPMELTEDGLPLAIQFDQPVMVYAQPVDL